jgi:trigger factor
MVKWEKIDGSKVSLEIEVEVERVDEALAKAYRKVVQKATVPGFRKGKVPRSVLEAKFGPEVLYEEALEMLIPEAYDRALSSTELEPIEQPQYDLVQMEKGKPMIFKAVVEVKPEVALPEYKGVKVEKKVKPIGDADVEGYLKRTQEQHARLVTVEDPDCLAEQGDLVVIDFKGFIGDEPFAGGEAEGHSLELGSNSFIPGFEEQLIGKKRDEEVNVTVTFPADYHEESLAGQEATFEVKVLEIKRKELPALDDDFAQEVSEFNTLAEFKEDVLKKLLENEESRAMRDVEEQLVQKIGGEAEVEIPDVLVERELDRMMGDMERFLRMQGLTLEQYMQMAGKSLKDIRQENREEGERRVKANLALDAIIKKEGIVAEEHEIDDRIAKFAAGYEQDPEKVKEMFASQGRIGIIEEEVKFRKVIDFLVAEAEMEIVPFTEDQPQEMPVEDPAGEEENSEEADPS